MFGPIRDVATAPLIDLVSTVTGCGRHWARIGLSSSLLHRIFTSQDEVLLLVIVEYSEGLYCFQHCRHDIV